MKYNYQFPNRLKILRESHNISMSELAEFLFMRGSAAINQFERGRSKPSIDTAIEIATFFGVSLEWLVGLSEAPYTAASIYVANEARIQRIHDLEDSLKKNIEGKITFFSDKPLVTMIKGPILPPSPSLNFQGNVIFLANATFLNDAAHLQEANPTTALVQKVNSHDAYVKRRNLLMHNKAIRYKALLDCYKNLFTEPLFKIS